MAVSTTARLLLLVCATVAAATAVDVPRSSSGGSGRITSPTIPIRGVGNNTLQMPVVGLGTAFGWSAAARNTTYTAVLQYLQNGGRAVHAARMYCNQAEVGVKLFVRCVVGQSHCSSVRRMKRNLGRVATAGKSCDIISFFFVFGAAAHAHECCGSLRARAI